MHYGLRYSVIHIPQSISGSLMAKKEAGNLSEAKALEQKANEWLARSITASSTNSLDQFSVRKRYKQGQQIKSSIDLFVTKAKGDNNDRLTELQFKLSQQLAQIKPRAVEQDYFRQMESLHSSSKPLSPLEPSDNEESDELEDDEDIISSTAISDTDTQMLLEVQAVGDFSALEAGDLSFKAGEILTVLDSSRDDGWLIVENALGQRGLAPSNYVTQFNPADSHRTTPVHPSSTGFHQRKGKELWAKVKSVVKQTSLGDVLSAMGAIPSGFRESTLAHLLSANVDYHTSSWLVPSLSPTFMSLVDLPWDHSKNKLASKAAVVSREFIIVSARMIPTTGANLTVLSRHIRVAIFDGKNILSNIRTIRVIWTPQEPKTWKLLQKTSSESSSLYSRAIAIRMNNVDHDLKVLFELGITVRKEKTGDVKELSCGWASLPLFEQNGHPAVNRAYELKIHGGTPFENGVELDPAQNIKASGRFFPTLLGNRRVPRLYVQFINSSKLTKTQLSWCPSTLVIGKLYVPLVGCYRQLLGSAFMKARSGSILPHYVNKPALGVFLRAVDQPDVMDAMLAFWTAALKSAKRSDRNNLEWMASVLERALLKKIYTLLYSSALPSSVWANEDVENERNQVILKHMQNSEDSKKTISQRGFDVVEQVFSLYPPAS